MALENQDRRYAFLHATWSTRGHSHGNVSFWYGEVRQSEARGLHTVCDFGCAECGQTMGPAYDAEALTIATGIEHLEALRAGMILKHGRPAAMQTIIVESGDPGRMQSLLDECRSNENTETGHAKVKHVGRTVLLVVAGIAGLVTGLVGSWLLFNIH